MKQFFTFLIFTLPFLAFFNSCEKKNHDKNMADFRTFMGENKSVWKFVETSEDCNSIHFYQDLYEKNIDLLLTPKKEGSIPYVMHFIWLGPNPFPKESIDNIKSWIALHPNWTYNFWTDRMRPLPDPAMKLQLITSYPFSKLAHCFEDSTNYAEQADILRYEILYNLGGLYIDHDVKCLKNFSPFLQNYDLFCGLEPPHNPVLSSSISVCNNLIGSKPFHPILEKCIELVDEKWIDVGNAYPGDDKESIIYRVANRSFSPFDEAVRLLANDLNHTNMIFPAGYFNQIDDDFAFYAHHYYASTWFEDETKFERNVRRRLISISRKNNQILLFNAVILTANVLLFGCLLYQFRMIRAFITAKKSQKNHDSKR